MKLHKVETYDAGYGENSQNATLIKAVVATAAAAAVMGGLTGCFGNSISGNMEYRPPEYDGYMSVSDSDFSSDPSACSSENEMFTLDGDVAYVPSEQG
ncbi:MAG: hypothetical protein IJM51_10645 [Clostridia bacterium]|nr:hypothetical protein [Clostridia bacterium]